MTSSDIIHKDKTMRCIKSRSRWKMASTLRQSTQEAVPCLLQDLWGMWKHQPHQGGVQVSVETAAGPETTKDWKVNT